MIERVTVVFNNTLVAVAGKQVGSQHCYQADDPGSRAKQAGKGDRSRYRPKR